MTEAHRNIEGKQQNAGKDQGLGEDHQVRRAKVQGVDEAVFGAPKAGRSPAGVCGQSLEGAQEEDY